MIPIITKKEMDDLDNNPEYMAYEAEEIVEDAS